MWSDSIRALEFPYSKYAMKSLGDVAWAQGLLKAVKDRGGIKAENSEMLFEVRFALELHKAGVEADYEYGTGIGDSKVDFHLKGDREWLIEIVSLRESKAVRDATWEDAESYEALLLPSNPADLRTLAGEMISVQRRIGEKVLKKEQITKFPVPASNGPVHVIIADMRGYTGEDPTLAAGYNFRPEYLQIAYGKKGLPTDQLENDPPLLRFWNGQPVKGLFEESNPTRSTKLIQERIHFVGFVYEKRYCEGSIPNELFMCPNLALFFDNRIEARRVYDSFPLRPPGAS
jgi:hypothetical protein